MTYANSFQFRSCIPEVDTSDSQMLTVKPAMIVIRQLHVDCIKIGVLFFYPSIPVKYSPGVTTFTQIYPHPFTDRKRVGNFKRRAMKCCLIVS